MAIDASNRRIPPKLQKKWTQILEKSGFDDIETPRGELKSRTADIFRSRGKADPLRIYRPHEVRDYFLALSHYVARAQFANKTERKIMELYADGLEVSEIARTVYRRGKLSWNWEKTNRVIRRHLEIFKLSP